MNFASWKGDTPHAIAARRGSGANNDARREARSRAPGGEEGKLCSLSARTNRLLTTEPRDLLNGGIAASWSPDGSEIVYVRENATGHIRIPGR
jgi:hypothetical protein